MNPYDPYDRLGMVPPPAVAAFEPRLVNATFIAVNPDVAIAKFRGPDGNEMHGVLPRSEAVRDVGWEVGARHLLLQQDASDKPLLSAVAPGIVQAIIEGISPEFRDGRVQVMKVARSIGSRCKIAVAATVDGVDPIAAAVGRAASRVKRLREGLGGEKVEIVAWHPDRAVYLRNALQPASVFDVVIDEENNSAVAKAAQHQMSAAVGMRGQNSSLAARLVGLDSVHIEPA